ncbi:hypothetical protein LDENG_00204340 [Lucifuga dentata]|nr:hypothetical protein LDENG_00204340 [Lucifuga dentata]
MTQPDTQKAEDPLSGNCPSVRNQEVKPSMVVNLKNLKKKFQKKRSTSQEHTGLSAEAEESNWSGNTENEYQEVTWEQTISGAPFSSTGTTGRQTDDGLPCEYLPPPPFAPGY